MGLREVGDLRATGQAMRLRTLLHRVYKLPGFVYGTMRLLEEQGGGDRLNIEVRPGAKRRARCACSPAGERPRATTRSAPAAPLPVRAGVAPAEVFRVCAAAGALPALGQGAGGAGAVGGGQGPVDRGLLLVPRRLGAAAVMEGRRGALPSFVEPRVPRGRDGGGVGPGARGSGGRQIQSSDSVCRKCI